MPIRVKAVGAAPTGAASTLPRCAPAWEAGEGPRGAKRLRVYGTKTATDVMVQLESEGVEAEADAAEARRMPARHTQHTWRRPARHTQHTWRRPAQHTQHTPGSTYAAYAAHATHARAPACS